MLAMKFLAFWKLRPRSWGGPIHCWSPNLKVGGPLSPGPYSCCAYSLLPGEAKKQLASWLYVCKGPALRTAPGLALALMRPWFLHFAFWAPFGGLGKHRPTVHLRLIGKLVLDFLFVLIQLFFARCWLRQILIGNQRFGRGWSVSAKFSRIKERSPLTIFARIGQWMPCNFVVDSIHTKKLCSRLSSSEGHRKQPFCVRAPFGGL